MTPEPQDKGREEWPMRPVDPVQEAIDEVYQDVWKAIQAAWPEPHDYMDSPLELIAELIEERDTLTAQVENRCSCGVAKARAHFCADLSHCWLSGAVIGGGA